jgi:tetratricopeptide (TPR) repeat protein
VTRSGYCRVVTPRTRVTLLVVVAAAVAAAVTLGAVLLQSSDDEPRAAAPQRPQGAPPLLLDLGVRGDAEAEALREAEKLWRDGRNEEARAAFARYDSTDALIGRAITRWPDGSVAALRRLAEEHPRRADVHLNLGFALFWAGLREEAVEAWRAARGADPDSLAAVRAGDLLFPTFARGLPVFVPSFEPPRGIGELPHAEQLERLERAAEGGGVREKLLYGVALQRIGRQVSARAQYDAAAALSPDEPEPLVAAAVARFDKDSPDGAFSRLGPLAARFPEEPTVRFHLGLLLLWMGELDDARRQLVRARDGRPDHPLAGEAARFLARLEDVDESPDENG